LAHRRRRGTAIIDTPQGILVVSESSNLFLLPGGGANPGESRRMAAIRELREQTGLETTECTYLFRYKGRIHKDFRGGHFWDDHKVFLVKTNGDPKPHHEIKEIAYYNGSNIKLGGSAQRIIERYNSWKNAVSSYAALRCTHCGAGLNVPDAATLVKCEYCGTAYHKKIKIDS
jgi:ADP-ribose pyrophosphatase YjhB (NUDIX family)/ribosomal protein S27E